MNTTIKMLCPKCQMTTEFSVNIKQIGNDIKVDNFYYGLSVNCPHCNCEMYAVDNELIDTLKLLNKNGIITMYHCDEYHNGNVNLTQNPDIIKNNKKWYFGPYVMIRNLTLDDLFYLGLAIERVIPEKSVTNLGEYNSFIKVNSQSIEHRSSLDIQVFGKSSMETIVQVFTNTTDPEYIKQCNQMLYEVFQIWLNILNEEGLKHEISDIQFHHMSGTSFKKSQSNNI